MTRIRVLRIIARMNVGGPALQVVGLTRGLNPDRFETRLLVGAVASDEADYLALRAPDLPVTVVPGLGRSVHVGGDATAFIHIMRHIRDFRPHIVHTHTAKAGALGRTAARLLRVPHIVHTFHGHLLHGYFSAPVGAVVRHVERVLARGTSRLAAVGAQVRDDLLEAGIGRDDQYVVMPPGVQVDDPPPRDVARRTLGLPADAPVAAFVARLTAVKRPDRAIATIRLLREQIPDVTLLIVGEGPLLADVRREAADLDGAVRFLGWRSDVETVYAAADVVLLTSDNEGMPVALIEAAMCGRPAVASAVGSSAEVVRHEETGLVVDADPRALADGVARLLRAPDLRAELGAAARRRAVDAFSTARLVADTERLYIELVGADLRE